MNSTLYLDPNPIFKADRDGGCTFVNYAWLKLTGFTGQEEAYGNGWIKAIHQEDRKAVIDEWDRSIEMESQFNMEYRYVNKITKDVTMVACRTTIVKDGQGKPLQVIGIVEILA